MKEKCSSFFAQIMALLDKPYRFLVCFEDERLVVKVNNQSLSLSNYKKVSWQTICDLGDDLLVDLKTDYHKSEGVLRICDNFRLAQSAFLNSKYVHRICISKDSFSFSTYIYDLSEPYLDLIIFKETLSGELLIAVKHEQQWYLAFTGSEKSRFFRYYNKL